MITKELLLETGKKKGIVNKGNIEKSYFQDVFLYNLFKKTNKFIFKGGTALYKLYGLPRFSEDLDFSIVENFSLEDAEKNVKGAAEASGNFKIKSIKKNMESLLVKISCKGILTGHNSLRIDVNFKNKSITGFDVKNYVPDYIDIAPFSLRILRLEEITAEKIHAVLNREKARDLYDLFFLLRVSKFNRKLVEEKLSIFGLKYDKKILEKKIANFSGVWEKELKAFILDELPDFNAVREFVSERLK